MVPFANHLRLCGAFCSSGLPPVRACLCRRAQAQAAPVKLDLVNEQKNEHKKAWGTYIVLRLLFFVVPFALLYVLALSMGISMTISGMIAAVLAALIGVALSMLLLSKTREQASVSIHEWRNRERTADDIVEDAALDGEGADD